MDQNNKRMNFVLDSKSLKLKEVLNKDFLGVEIYAISEGETRNDCAFTLESMEKAIPTFYNKFILGYFNVNKINNGVKGDFEEHNADLRYDEDLDDVYWSYTNSGSEKALGLIRESDTVEIAEYKGKKWIKLTAVILTKYNREAVKNLLRSRSKKKVSVEITVVSSHKDENDLDIIDEFVLDGITILGTRRNSLIPCNEGIEGASLRTLEFLNSEVFSKQRMALSFAYKELDKNSLDENEHKEEIIMENNQNSSKENLSDKNNEEKEGITMTYEQEKELLETAEEETKEFAAEEKEEAKECGTFEEKDGCDGCDDCDDCKEEEPEEAKEPEKDEEEFAGEKVCEVCGKEQCSCGEQSEEEVKECGSFEAKEGEGCEEEASEEEPEEAKECGNFESDQAIDGEVFAEEGDKEEEKEEVKECGSFTVNEQTYTADEIFAMFTESQEKISALEQEIRSFKIKDMKSFGESYVGKETALDSEDKTAILSTFATMCEELKFASEEGATEYLDVEIAKAVYKNFKKAESEKEEKEVKEFSSQIYNTQTTKTSKSSFELMSELANKL